MTDDGDDGEAIDDRRGLRWWLVRTRRERTLGREADMMGFTVCTVPRGAGGRRNPGRRVVVVALVGVCLLPLAIGVTIATVKWLIGTGVVT